MPDRRELNEQPLTTPEIRCPLGFTVRLARVIRKDADCGYSVCYPSACERLRRLGIQTCEEEKK